MAGGIEEQLKCKPKDAENYAMQVLLQRADEENIILQKLKEISDAFKIFPIGRARYYG